MTLVLVGIFAIAVVAVAVVVFAIYAAMTDDHNQKDSLGESRHEPAIS